MSRRRKAEKRDVLPDSQYNDKVVTKFINGLMIDGKKSIAEGIFYTALKQITEETQEDTAEDTAEDITQHIYQPLSKELWAAPLGDLITLNHLGRCCQRPLEFLSSYS